MIMLIDCIPGYCASCGQELEMGKYSLQDFYSKSSFTCRCGLHYQLCETRILLQAATQTGGDLAHTMDR